MTDLDAIRARHVESKVKGVVGYTVCYAEGTEWPCDTYIVLAALDDDARIVAALAEEHREYVAAAIEREARLRAALRDCHKRAEAALATTHVGSEGTDSPEGVPPMQERYEALEGE